MSSLFDVHFYYKDNPDGVCLQLFKEQVMNLIAKNYRLPTVAGRVCNPAIQAEIGYKVDPNGPVEISVLTRFDLDEVLDILHEHGYNNFTEQTINNVIA
jgi:hypothetical protein